MEKLKPIEQVNQADERNLYFVRLDTGMPVTFEDQYSQIAAISLNPTTPEDVRSYFATIQNLCAYAWFAYDFYAVVDFLSYTLIEMALKARLSIKEGTLYPLLKKAIKLELIEEKAFSHVRQRRQERAMHLRMMRQIQKIPRSSVPRSDYPKVLLRTLPKLRNALAHPRGHAIQLPGGALFSLRFAAEFINQLFP